ncbi:MAG: ParB/RepB/Spo0J family partition protein [Deltaproteobacteria bacterium]|nr:ParB/RepB/Spo0J family partition protein [Deltaproteobacteria bacterium]
MTKRKALGKGLSALIPDGHDLDEKEELFFLCPVAAIEANPNQPRQRFPASELEEMVASVREKGILTPLLVNKTESGYQLIAGERRWRAAQMAGLERVPVVVRDVSPSESLELALIENIQRKDLNPIEEALACRKLMEDTGSTQEILSQRLGKNRSTIANLLRLLKLPTAIQQDVIDDRLTMGHARLLAGITENDQQRVLRDAIVNKELSVRQAEALARKLKKPPTPKKVLSKDDPYIRSLSDNLKRSLGTKVEIKKEGKRGQILLYFYSDDELDRLVEFLT